MKRKKEYDGEYQPRQKVLEEFVEYGLGTQNCRELYTCCPKSQIYEKAVDFSAA